MVSLSVLI